MVMIINTHSECVSEVLNYIFETEDTSFSENYEGEGIDQEHVWFKALNAASFMPQFNKYLHLPTETVRQQATELGFKDPEVLNGTAVSRQLFLYEHLMIILEDARDNIMEIINSF